MYCPRCGDGMEETKGTFVCVRGNMPLSPYIAKHLYAVFVSNSEDSKDFIPNRVGRKLGGTWFCPACGVQMTEEAPSVVSCPSCGRNMAKKYVEQLIELHPHL
jgi:rubredoxin